MKKALTALTVMMVSSILIASSIAAGFVALLGEEEEPSYPEYERLDSFEIEGTREGNTLNITFKSRDGGYSIDNIQINLSEQTGTITTYVTMPVNADSREAQAMEYLLRNGFTREGAAGVIANMRHECGNFASNREEGDAAYREPTVIGKGFGLFQWTNTWGDPYDRRYKIVKHLESLGIDPAVDSDESFMAQLAYALNEKPWVTEKVKNAKSSEEAADLWCRYWEIPRYVDTQSKLRAKESKVIMSEYEGFTSAKKEAKSQVPLTLTYEISEEQRNGAINFAQGICLKFSGMLNANPIAGAIISAMGEIKMTVGIAYMGPGATEKIEQGNQDIVAVMQESAGKHITSFPSYFHHYMVNPDWGGESAWCGDFVYYCVSGAGVWDLRGYDFNYSWATDWTQVALWKGREAPPEPGDVIVYSYGGGHVGLIESVDENYIYTIEGNTSGDGEFYVLRKTRSRSDPEIIGWGTP